MKRNVSSIMDPNRDWRDAIEQTIKAFQVLHELPFIDNTELISSSFYNYCLKGKYFVVIALYNENRDFFIQRDFAKRNQTWELVGGWIKQDETVDQALDRIVAKETGSILVEATPVAIVKNNYLSDQKENIFHVGLAFMGRVLRDKTESQNGVFSDTCEKLLNKNDMKIWRLAKIILEHKVIEPPIREIENSSHGKLVTFINRFVVKPISYNFSSKILSREICKAVIGENSSRNKKVLDVACGDDRSISLIANKVNLFVANDISRLSMSGLVKKFKRNNVFFTNQNLLELNFKTEFDVVICKNVMHHMRNPEETELMLNVLRKLGKRTVIMDIENPTKSFLPRIWNDYYVKVLKDQGGLFMSFDQFKEVIELCFKGSKKIDSRIVPTIKGNYMLAIIDR